MLAPAGDSSTSSSSRSYSLTVGRRVIRPVVAVCAVIAVWYYASSFAPSSRVGGQSSFAPLSKVEEQATFASLSKNNDQASTLPSPAPSIQRIPKSTETRVFWDSFATIIAKGKPSFDKIEIDDQDDLYVSYDPGEEKARLDLLVMSEVQVEEMRVLHSGVVDNTRILAPKLPFVKGTRGIIVSVGNDGLTVLVASLRMLRITGCTLPVEVLMNVIEDNTCNIILPGLGAKCIRLNNHMSETARAALPFEKYGFKSAAIAFSSFEQVLILDHDLFPVMDPEALFSSEPFLSTGMVLWPDYWASTTAPQYYQIAGTPEPDLRDRASTESGAILIDKSSHAETLLLSIYYNIYTWGLYYRIFSQGATGEGDKETYAAAAAVFNQSVYHVNEAPERIGYSCDDNDRIVGSGQHHPADDWYLLQQGIDRKGNPDDDGGSIPAPRVLFIHGNLPKYDAANVLEWWMPNLDWTDMLRCDEGKGRAHRLWGPKETTVAKYGWDVEKHLWDSMRWVACEHGSDFAMWANGTWHSEPKAGMCEKMVAFYEELLSDEVYEKVVKVHNRESSPAGGQEAT